MNPRDWEEFKEVSAIGAAIGTAFGLGCGCFTVIVGIAIVVVFAAMKGVVQ